MQSYPQALRTAFCRWYLALADPAEAARRAGCPPETAAADGLALLRLSACRAALRRMNSQPPVPLRDLVIAGLSRLAFAPANDAVKLAFAEESLSADDIAQLDLFHISELRRDRSGKVEIKLFDRQKAMEKLLECAGYSDEKGAADALLRALSGETGTESADDPFAVAALPSSEGCAADG